LPQFYQAKRDLFLELIKDSRFRAIPASGTYFQLLDYSDISTDPEEEFARWLTREHGIAAIPTSAFYHRPTDHYMLRFCFAKTEETLKKAADILCRI
ncbi:MAG: aminotransferase class I/II-fold pyridoxal phosphate-dependent enzyme, partial [Bacteroidales bacterium]|nr:aminotransferase class I/II-fold pyridoxal phosphate-dependent enzyme [Bacteroidales bacterium]